MRHQNNIAQHTGFAIHLLVPEHTSNGMLTSGTDLELQLPAIVAVTIP